MDFKGNIYWYWIPTNVKLYTRRQSILSFKKHTDIIMKKIDIWIWNKYWRLTILREGEKEWYYKQVICKCDCWNTISAGFQNVKRWNTKSCWCLELELKKTRKPNYKHWLYKHRLYQIWNAMMSRCYNKWNIWYKIYWGKWIVVCEKRKRIDGFVDDMWFHFKEWLTIDRINPKWNYEPLNCRRTDMKTQQNNKLNNINIEYNWQIKTLMQWSKSLWIKYHKMYLRLYRYNRTINKTFTTK